MYWRFYFLQRVQKFPKKQKLTKSFFPYFGAQTYFLNCGNLKYHAIFRKSLSSKLRLCLQSTSVSKKLAQTTAVYHYCILGQFFWNRLYSKSPRNFWNYGAKYIVLMSDFWPLARQSGPRNSFVGRPFIRHLPKYHSISSCRNFGQVWTCL